MRIARRAVQEVRTAARRALGIAIAGAVDARRSRAVRAVALLVCATHRVRRGGRRRGDDLALRVAVHHVLAARAVPVAARERALCTVHARRGLRLAVGERVEV